MRQALVGDYYGAEILYYFFRASYCPQMKKIKKNSNPSENRKSLLKSAEDQICPVLIVGRCFLTGFIVEG